MSQNAAHITEAAAAYGKAAESFGRAVVPRQARTMARTPGTSTKRRRDVIETHPLARTAAVGGCFGAAGSRSHPSHRHLLEMSSAEFEAP